MQCVDIVRRLPTLASNLLERHKLQQRIQPGDYFINGYDNHPCLVVRCELTSVSEVGPWDYDIVGVSIVDGRTETSNSARYSGLTPLPYEVAINHLIVAFWTRGTGPAIWRDAAAHAGRVLTNNTDYQVFASTK
jgi:hypothetical protein